MFSQRRSQSTANKITSIQVPITNQTKSKDTVSDSTSTQDDTFEQMDDLIEFPLINFIKSGIYFSAIDNSRTPSSFVRVVSCRSAFDDCKLELCAPHRLAILLLFMGIGICSVKPRARHTLTR